MTYYNLSNITDSTDYSGLVFGVVQQVPVFGTLIYVAFSIILLASMMLRLEFFSALLATLFICVLIGIIMVSLGLVSGYILTVYILLFLLALFHNYA